MAAGNEARVCEHINVSEHCALLGHSAASIGNTLAMFSGGPETSARTTG